MFAFLNNIANGFKSFLLSASQFFINGVTIAADSLEEETDLLDEEKISSFAEIATGVMKVMKNIVGPIMIAVGVFFTILLIYLGVMYAKAEDASKRKELMGRLIGCAIGLVIILVGIAVVYAINWVELYAEMTGHKHDFKGSTSHPDYCQWCGQKTGSKIHS